MSLWPGNSGSDSLGKVKIAQHRCGVGFQGQEEEELEGAERGSEGTKHGGTNQDDQPLCACCILCAMLCFVSVNSVKNGLSLPLLYR